MALGQRNALLQKNRQLSPQMETMLELWEDALAKYGSVYAGQRKKYVDKIRPIAEEFYHELSGKKEVLEILYDGEELIPEKNGEEKLKGALQESRETDARLGYTSVGPHRHDLQILINGVSARTFGSQGQQRSAALALKMAEAEVMAEYFEEQPIILLDDVMSELDSSRQDFILNKFENKQIFITCCDPASVLRLYDGKSFYIEKGEIFEQPRESIFKHWIRSYSVKADHHRDF